MMNMNLREAQGPPQLVVQLMAGLYALVISPWNLKLKDRFLKIIKSYYFMDYLHLFLTPPSNIQLG